MDLLSIYIGIVGVLMILISKYFMDKIKKKYGDEPITGEEDLKIFNPLFTIFALGFVFIVWPIRFFIKKFFGV